MVDFVPVSIYDGSSFRHFDGRFPQPPADIAISGAQVLDLAEIIVSYSLYGFVLPENLKHSALLKIGVSDTATFRSKTLDYSDADAIFLLYIRAMADELRDNPFAVGLFDGRPLKVKMETDVNFLTDTLFVVDFYLEGEIVKTTISGLRQVLRHFGNIGMIPRESECPRLAEILNRYGANGTQEVEASAFRNLMLAMLREVVDNLAREPALVVLSFIKVVNGSETRKLLARERLPDEIVENITTDQYIINTDMSWITKIRFILEKYGHHFGLPGLVVPEMRVILYDSLTEVASHNGLVESGSDTLMVVLKRVLAVIADKLAENPLIFTIVPIYV